MFTDVLVLLMTFGGGSWARFFDLLRLDWCSTCSWETTFAACLAIPERDGPEL